MRKFFFLISISLLSGITFSQQPTKEQMQAQMAQAKKESQQMITDLEKEIADAKLRGDDPESIQEMEKQLATMKKMVGVLDQSSTLSNTNRTATLKPLEKTEPKYISPFTPVTLNQAVKPPAKEQATDQLLWYTGKKIDANTLITVSGLIVRYDRQRNIVIVQTDKRVDTLYYGLVNTLAQTPQLKNQFAIGMTGLINSFLMWPEIKKAYDEYNFFRDRYYNIAKNTIEVPAPQPNVILEHWHQLLVSYINNLPTLQNIAQPPKRPNDLCNCDPDEREGFEDRLEAWLEKDFYKEEQKILSLLTALYTQGIAINAGRPLPANLKPDIAKAYDLVLERSRLKLWELYKQYESPDIYVEDGLVLAAMSLQKLLMNIYSDIEEPTTRVLKQSAYSVIDRIRDQVLQNKVFEKYMKDQLAAKNYNVVLDYSLYLSHEYNKRILSPSYNINENFFQTWMESLKKFNRFTLSISFDVDYRIESENNRGIKATATLESKPVIVSLGRSSCKWHFYMTDVNHEGQNTNEDDFYIPVKVINGTKTIYRDPEPPIILNYSGPLEMEMVFPGFELSFCKSAGPDTIYMEPLRYAEKVANAYMAAHPKIDFGKEFSLDMFQYTNKLFVSALKTKDNASDLIDQAGKMMNIQGQVQMPNSTGNQNLDKLLMDYTLNQKRRLLQQERTPITNTSKTILKFNANNGDTQLVSASFDMADPSDPDRAAGIKLAVGLIKIKIIHSPR